MDHLMTQKILNFFYAFLSVVSQTGQNVALPLWIDSGQPRETINTTTTSNSTDEFHPFMDQTIVSTFLTITLLIIYGVLWAIKAVFSAKSFSFKLIPWKLLVLTSLCSVISDDLIMFSASGKRTAPYLQAILTNITIPATVVLRYFILKKSPTRKRLICAIVTVLSLFVCLLPSIVPGIDQKSRNSKVQGGAIGIAGTIWPLIYLAAFIFQALTYIVSEKLFQSTRDLDVVGILFLTHCVQLVLAPISILLDAIPFFGNVNSLAEVILNLSFGVRCFFGKGGCSFYPALYGTLFILFSCGFMLGSSCLLRYSEGATYMALVLVLTTPLGFFFWTLFKEQPTLHWHPEMSVTMWLNIIGLVFMVPAIYIYNTEANEKIAELQDQQEVDTSPLIA